MANQIDGIQSWQPWHVGQVRYLRTPEIPGKSVESGIWKGTKKDVPDRSRVRYRREEFIYVIKGRVRLEVDGGGTHEIGPGDCFAFGLGDIVYWTLLCDELEEFFVYV